MNATEQILKADLPALDRLVFERVFGGKVLGEAWCWAPDGCWSVLKPADDMNQDDVSVDELGRRFAHGCELRPVYCKYEYLATDETDDVWNPKILGISAVALAPVPWYSTDIRDAWRVIAAMTSRGHKLQNWFEVCLSEVSHERRRGRAFFTAFLGAPAERFAEEVCRAALMALDRDQNWV